MGINDVLIILSFWVFNYKRKLKARIYNINSVRTETLFVLCISLSPVSTIVSCFISVCIMNQINYILLILKLFIKQNSTLFRISLPLLEITIFLFVKFYFITSNKWFKCKIPYSTSVTNCSYQDLVLWLKFNSTQVDKIDLCHHMQLNKSNQVNMFFWIC